MISLHRITVFLRERFPVGPSIVGAALLATAADRLGSGLIGRTLGGLDGISLAAVTLVAALFLVLRVADELSDLDEDRLAWPDRPLARGATLPRDVIALAVVVSAVAVALCGAAAGGAGIAGAVVALGVTLVLQQDLGLEAVRRRPLLSLAVHQLMVPAWALAVLALRDVAIVVEPARWPWPALGLALTLSLLFELGRKTRHPADEVAHDDSYSQRLGLRGSVATVTLTALVCAAAAVWVVHTLHLAVWAAAVPCAALVWVIGVAFTVPRRRGRLLEMSTALASLWVYLPLLLATA